MNRSIKEENPRHGHTTMSGCVCTKRGKFKMLGWGHFVELQRCYRQDPAHSLMYLVPGGGTLKRPMVRNKQINKPSKRIPQSLLGAQPEEKRKITFYLSKKKVLGLIGSSHICKGSPAGLQEKFWWLDKGQHSSGAHLPKGVTALTSDRKDA